MEFMSSTIAAACHPQLMMTHRSRPSFVSMKLIPPPPASITVPCKLARNPNYETPRHIIITKPSLVKYPNTLSFLKTTFVTVVTVSAIFLSPRRFTSMAAPVESKIINTELMEEHDEVIKALKTLMEYKVKNGKVAGIINQLKYHLHGGSTDDYEVDVPAALRRHVEESAAAAKKTERGGGSDT